MKVEIDLTGIPEDMVDAFVNRKAPCPERRRAAALKASQAAAAKQAQRRKERAAAWRAINHTPGVYDRKGDTGDRILAAAAEWITQYELRTQLGISHNMLAGNIDRMWRAGELEKRLNPARAENRRRSVGVARCEFQYRRAQKEPAP